LRRFRLTPLALNLLLYPTPDLTVGRFAFWRYGGPENPLPCGTGARPVSLHNIASPLPLQAGNSRRTWKTCGFKQTSTAVGNGIPGKTGLMLVPARKPSDSHEWAQARRTCSSGTQTASREIIGSAGRVKRHVATPVAGCTQRPLSKRWEHCAQNLGCTTSNGRA
jgi:hypothetical protein